MGTVWTFRDAMAFVCSAISLYPDLSARRDGKVGKLSMIYKEAIRCLLVGRAGEDSCTVFIGYNVTRGSRIYGTLVGIKSSQCIETPCAENLMTGLAIGMALEGYNPILIFERHDFILNAMDALVNHLAKIKKMSHGEFDPAKNVLVRTIVGNKKPLDPGPQHCANYSFELRRLLPRKLFTIEHRKKYEREITRKK